MISQNAFDAMVKENMDDFELSKASALAETIQQLKSMGKDLSQIDITGGEGRDEIIEMINIIKKYTSESTHIDDFVSTLVQLSTLCHDKHVLGSRNQNLVRSNGGMSAIINVISPNTNIIVLKRAFDLLDIICRSNVNNRDLFEPFGSEKLCRTVSKFMANIADLQSQDMIQSCLKCVRTLSKSENNKAGLAANGISDIICHILSLPIQSHDISLQSLLLHDACLAIRALCIHDDTRREMSCAYDNGKQFMSLGCVPSLLFHASNFLNDAEVASSALFAVRQLVVSEDAVKAVAIHGAMHLPSEIYKWPGASSSLIRSVTGLMRNLCADDARKTALVHDGTLQLLVGRLAETNKFSDYIFVEHAYACFAAMTLRSPQNSLAVLECGAIHVMVAGMRRHANRTGLLRQGCLTIRNIAARCPDHRGKLLDEGVESILRGCGGFRDVVDEAYGALRDLGCEVTMVKVNEDGSAEAAYEQFGEGVKPKFNPVYDETYDINQRVVNESRAPFAIQEDEDDDSYGYLESHVHDANCNH